MGKAIKNWLLLLLGFVALGTKGQTYNMTNTVVTTCSGIFYDDGSSGANYTNNVNLTQTFTAPTPNYRMHVQFTSFDTELNFDSLSAYDGTSIASPFLGKFSGSLLPPDLFSTNENITFHFVSDAATNSLGWSANLSCFGLIGMSPITASQSQTIAITVDGSNTLFQWGSPPNNVYLKHTVSNNTFSTSAITVLSGTQLTATITVPCGADIGLYDLYVDQPTVGETKLTSAFTVTDFLVNSTTNSPMCFGGSDGSISLSIIGGTPLYSYYWQPGSFTTQNISGLTAGTYSCNITDGLGCIRQKIVNLTQPSPITTSPFKTDITCFGMANGSANSNVSGGTPPYNYNWQPNSATTANISNLSPGTYSCNIVDINGCTTNFSISIIEPAAFTSSVAMQTNPTCFGYTNGVAVVGTNGGVSPFAYNWAPSGGTASSATNIGAGTYTCTVTDANGCTSMTSVTLTQPAAFTSSIAMQTNPTCFGYTNGVAVVGTNGGVSPFTYNWMPSGGTASSETNIGAGNYTCTVTDANGCTTLTNATLTEPTAVIVNAGLDVSICTGSSTNLSSSTSGGSPGYSFSWSPSFGLSSTTTANTVANPSSSTTYTLTSVDVNGCSGVDAVVVTVNAAPPLSLNSSSTNICAGVSTTLTANAPTATSILWSNSATTTSIIETPLTNTLYWVKATDASGCMDSMAVNIYVTPSKSISGNIVNETTGNVILYKYSSTLSLFDSVTFVPITSSSYNFASVDSAQYVVKVIPGTGTNQITYGDSATSWLNATIINHGCTNNSVMTVSVVPLVNIGVGSGSMSGTITQTVGFGHRPNDGFFKPTTTTGQPIGGIVVKGGRNPGGQMFTQTTTDPTTGTYTLSGIPDGTNYFILVDIPGLDTNLTYHRDLTPGNNQLTGLDFTVDSMYINPINNSVGINDLNFIDHQLIIYPNPTAQFININYELKNASIVNIDLIDMLGRPIKVLLKKSFQIADSYKQQFSVAELKTGVYFIRLNIDQNESNVKLIITD